MTRHYEPVTVSVADLHPDGYGLSEDGQHAVLGSLPGETVIAMPFRRRRKRTFSHVQSIEIATPDRVAPECSVASVCGGCSLQHLQHTKQVGIKQALWREHFLVHPKEIIPPVMGPCFNYRSKARLGVRYVEKKGRVLVGFREKMNGYITETESCKVLREPIGELIAPLAELVMTLADPTAVPQIEVAIGDRDAALVLRHLRPFTDKDLSILRGFACQAGVQLYLQPGDATTVHRIAPQSGSELLFYDLPDQQLRMYFGAMDFTQVNHEINRKMVNQALALLSPGEGDVVLDAFAGIGNFSLAAARHARRVIGVEAAPASVDRARYNAAANAIGNAQFKVHDLFKSPLGSLLEGVSHVIVDPPRSGAEALVRELIDHAVLRLVYVSCNPETLARDASILVEGGYQFEKAGVVDMFPHTTHIESMALFTRSDASPRVTFRNGS